MSHVFPEGEQLQSAFELFEKTCRLCRALSDEEVSENPMIAIAHKNLHDAELLKHLPRSPATLDRFTGRGHHYSPAEAAARGTALTYVDQVNLVKGKGKTGTGKKSKGRARGRMRKVKVRVTSGDASLGHRRQEKE